MHSWIRKAENDFALSRDMLLGIIEKFKSEMDKGLAGGPSSLQVLPTFVGEPTGEEKGRYLVMDLGGTHFRIMMVELHGDRTLSVTIKKRYTLSRKHTTGTGVDFFNALAEFTYDFLQQHKLLEKSFSVGFTFSFPMALQAINKALLVRWTKGFTASGVEGNDVVKQLNEAFQRKKLHSIKIMCICNDGTALQTARAYLDGHCSAALIVGTGTVIMYTEKVGNIKGIARQFSSDKMIINTESGNFPYLPVNAFDRKLDSASSNPGYQIQEKMVSGKYLGQLAYHAVNDAQQSGTFNAGENASRFRFDTLNKSLTTENMAAIEATNACRWIDLLKLSWQLKTPSIIFDNANIASLQCVCSMISTRASRLTSAVLMAVLEHMDPLLNGSHIVATEGSVIEKYPGFLSGIMSTIAEIYGQKTPDIKLKATPGGSAIGSAVVAAMAEKKE